MPYGDDFCTWMSTYETTSHRILAEPYHSSYLPRKMSVWASSCITTTSCGWGTFPHQWNTLTNEHQWMGPMMLKNFRLIAAQSSPVSADAFCFAEGEPSRGDAASWGIRPRQKRNVLTARKEKLKARPQGSKTLPSPDPNTSRGCDDRTPIMNLPMPKVTFWRLDRGCRWPIGCRCWRAAVRRLRRLAQHNGSEMWLKGICMNLLFNKSWLIESVYIWRSQKQAPKAPRRPPRQIGNLLTAREARNRPCKAPQSSPRHLQKPPEAPKATFWQVEKRS